MLSFVEGLRFHGYPSRRAPTRYRGVNLTKNHLRCQSWRRPGIAASLLEGVRHLLQRSKPLQKSLCSLRSRHGISWVSSSEGAHLLRGVNLSKLWGEHLINKLIRCHSSNEQRRGTLLESALVSSGATLPKLWCETLAKLIMVSSGATGHRLSRSQLSTAVRGRMTVQAIL